MNYPESGAGGKGRRDFIKNTAAAALLLAAGGRVEGAGSAVQTAGAPWYRTVTRWGQVNITEKDPQQYDIHWWRGYWKRTNTKGIVVNAGGIVAYYPTKIPLHRKAEYLGDGDLFGDLCRVAHEDGLAVFARMDSNRAHGEFYKAHPDWFAVNANGEPYRADDLYIACINSPYYSEHIPSILREIATTYHPEGFTDNSWSGLGRESICYCGYCRKSFKEKTGLEIPLRHNWTDNGYKKWIRWNYDRRLEIWDLNNATTKAAGGPNCIWSGMNSGSISGQSKSFRDFKAIAQRADIIMLDDQARSDTGGFQHNGEAGKLIHGILGWDKLIPESMAQYQAHKPWFRVASKPEPEARMWMIEGLAGGIQPWWHMVGAYHEDRRMYHNPEAIFHWQAANEAFLINRRPVASIGVVWSQENMDFYGGDVTEERVELPWRGMTQALIRARIPYLPVHADLIDRDAAGLSVLILPNLAVMSDEQVAAVRRHVSRGGSLIATGETSLYDEWGVKRSDFALGDLFGAHASHSNDLAIVDVQRKLAGEAYHTYLRLTPELRSQVDGPHMKDEPPVSGKRHPIMQGFEETDILPFGGLLERLNVDPGAEVLLTFIPQFPVYPPEKAWMRIPRTDIPGLIVRDSRNVGRDSEKSGRVVFVPADLDRQYGRSNLPDHGNLLRNIVNWAAEGAAGAAGGNPEHIPVVIEGAGLIDTHLYQQPGRLILHLVNLTNENTWRQPLDELISIGPLKVKVKLTAGLKGYMVSRLVGAQGMVPGLTSGTPVTSGATRLATGGAISSRVANGWCHFEINSITDHEVIVIA